MIGYPYSYGDRLTPEIARNNRKQAVSYSVLIPTLWWYNLGFGEPIQSYFSGGNSQPKTEICRVLEQKSPSMRDLNQEGSAQPEQVLKGTQSAQTALKIPSGGSDNTSSRPSKFGPGSKAKGAAKRDFARRQTTNKPTSGKSSGTIFAEAFTAKPNFPARPGGNGLFGRFSARPTPDPSNPGCAGGPRSITVRSSQQNQSEYQPDGYSEEQIATFEKNPIYSELSKDPQLTGQECETNPKSREEACTILQAEEEGLVSGARRPNLKAGDSNYDYKTDSPTKFSEIKVPRDASLQDAARLGRKSGLQQGNDGDVTIIVNLMRLRPENRGPYAKAFLEAAGGNGVIFINK